MDTRNNFLDKRYYLIKEWLVEPFLIFITAIPTFVFWLALPALLCILSFWYQSGVVSRNLMNQSPTQLKAEFSVNNGETLRLVIYHPQTLLLEPDIDSLVPISIWLVRQSCQDFAALLTSVPSLNAGTPTAIVLNESDICNRTEFEANPFIVHLSADTEKVIFTNGQGHPIPSEVAVLPSSSVPTPATIYIKPLASDDQQRTPVNLRAYIADPRCTDAGCPDEEISMDVESVEEAQVRHFQDTLLGTTTLILTMFTAAAGFAVQQWNKFADEQQRKRAMLEEETRREKLLEPVKAEIASLRQLLERENYSEGARRYLAYLEKTDPAWLDPEMQELLNSTWKEAAPKELQNFVDLLIASRSKWKNN